MQRPREIQNWQLSFEEASTEWIESRRPFLAPRTFQGYSEYIKMLRGVFGEMRLSEITGDQIRAYQRMRMSTAGASIINHECSVLQQMLKRAGRWHEIAYDYQPLQLPRESPGRALTKDEEERLYRIGPNYPTWDVAYCTAVISINTTAGPGELRHMRLQDFDKERRTIRVQPEGAKNDERIRTIPLNDEAYKAVLYLVERARGLGAAEPQHYIIPFRVKRRSYDPDRPTKGWRTAHDQLMGACGIKCRIYDFRHHAITRLLENSVVSEQTAEALAGHISHKMKKRYSHIRIETKRAAVTALSKIPPSPVPRSVEADSLTNADVVEMLKDLSADIVVAKIKISNCCFETGAGAMKELKAGGIPDSILLAMVRATRTRANHR